MLALSRSQLATFYATVVAVFALVLADADLFPLRIVYNASASVPLGWYAVADPDAAGAGELVVVRPPLAVEPMLVERGYLGRGVPLLKRIGAGPGSTVCRHDNRISIDGTPAAVARDADARGRPLPRWSGCRLISAGEVFLVNSGAPGSFDGRYFGPSFARDIIGKARPVWTW